MSAEEMIQLRVNSGVPIVDVLGEWEAAVLGALTEMVNTLMDAGHYEIVVNVQRATTSGIAGLHSLARAAQAVRLHCGHIDVVGTAEQVDHLLRQQAEKLFRLATSEEVAIGRIKRTPVLSAGSRCTARPIT